MHAESDLVGLSLLHARIIGALTDEQRRLDVVDVEEGRDLAIELGIGVDVANLKKHIIAQRPPVRRDRVSAVHGRGVGFEPAGTSISQERHAASAARAASRGSKAASDASSEVAEGL